MFRPENEQEQIRLIKKLQQTAHPILITGPTGSGKDYLAKKIHHEGKRNGSPFVAVNCSAIPLALFEAQVFGHVKGSFTGAIADNSGYCGMTGNGTLFLDEIADLPLESQPKLLRLLENKTYIPVGSSKEMAFTGRIIAATHKNLEILVKKGDFREDLFHRLSVFHIQTKPLAERSSEIEKYITDFFTANNHKLQFSACALQQMQAYDWPGNIRQLKNILEQIMVCHESDYIDSVGVLRYLPLPQTSNEISSHLEKILQNLQGDKLLSLEQHLLNYVLDKHNGNRSAAARELGVERKCVERRINFFNKTIEDARKILNRTDALQESMLQPDHVRELTQKLNNLNSLNSSTEVRELQLRFNIHLSHHYRRKSGWASRESMDYYTASQKLCFELNRIEEMGQIFFGFWAPNLVLGYFDKALDLANEFYNNSSRFNSHYGQRIASLGLANTHYWLGDLHQTSYYLERFRATTSFVIYKNQNDRDEHQALYLLFLILSNTHQTKDIDVQFDTNAVNNLIATSTSAYVQTICYQALAWSAFLREEDENCLANSEEFISVAREHDFKQYQGLGMLFKSYALAKSGRFTEARRLISESDALLISADQPLTILYTIRGIVYGELLLAYGSWTAGELHEVQKAVNFCREHQAHIMLGHLLFILTRLNRVKSDSEQIFEAISVAQSHGCQDVINKIESWRNNERSTNCTNLHK